MRRGRVEALDVVRLADGKLEAIAAYPLSGRA